ncbi:DUF6088 family protein [Mycoplasma sp. CSL7503-lung]|uniref:DUF6088 family protein n=1 Tax=Mycoplasma sp. CSL7503-lung TaxID=536372 RepID=UPI0021D1FF33|nr:DUF6088 family protein [Mycoplasma sp. CSL7503-lung]MCU4706815.1 DUF6088 family protein [Mycoplasma sp. CSL7503-lung]
MSYKKQIVEKINSFSSNYVFITNDFYDIANYETIKSTLNRLVQNKKIFRITNGVYYKPQYWIN